MTLTCVCVFLLKDVPLETKDLSLQPTLQTLERVTLFFHAYQFCPSVRCSSVCACICECIGMFICDLVSVYRPVQVYILFKNRFICAKRPPYPGDAGVVVCRVKSNTSLDVSSI